MDKRKVLHSSLANHHQDICAELSTEFSYPMSGDGAFGGLLRFFNLNYNQNFYNYTDLDQPLERLLKDGQ